jgi:hypothetical protein
MPTILKTKNSVTTTVVPTTLQQGELAVNITDKKMWVGNAATTPVQLFGAGADGSFVNLAYTGTLTGGTGVVNLGSGQFYKDASGNLGIGTSSPNYLLNTYAATGGLSIQYVAQNSNGASGVAAIGFSVSTVSGGEGLSTKGGIGFQRNAAYGGGFMQFFNNNSGAAGDFTTADENLRLTFSGDVVLKGGNVNAGGTGITFPVTQSASSDANTLDDYEEGTWTPVVTSLTGSITTYTSAGQYRKIGSLVVAQFQYGISDNGTGATAVALAGLPFAGTTNTAGGLAREIAVAGVSGGAYLSGTTTMLIVTAAGAYMGGTNWQVVGTLSYQAT